MKKCLTEKDYFGRDGVTAENCYSLVNQPRKNVGFFMSTRLGVGCPLNKALPNKTGWKAIQFSTPSAFSIGEKANQYQSSEKGDSLMTTSINTPIPSIQVINNQAVTTSLNVAEFFGKRHDDVLKAIRNIIKKDAEWGLRNFAECEIIRDIPLQGEKAMPYYNITRDGFTMLAMGFTGEKAFKFKIAYIQAFNKMEAELSGKPLQLDTASTKADREPLTNLVNTLVSAAPLSYRDVWHLVKAELKTTKKAAEFTIAEVHRAIEFAQRKIDQYCAHDDIITEQALKGTKAFIVRVSVEEPAKSKGMTLVHRQFKATVYITEEQAPHEISTQINHILHLHHDK